jgi:hypothetical protein
MSGGQGLSTHLVNGVPNCAVAIFEYDYWAVFAITVGVHTVTESLGCAGINRWVSVIAVGATSRH